jgi:CelD/BcsL family acetyltransferase involved in cellulose biosynthesis
MYNASASKAELSLADENGDPLSLGEITGRPYVASVERRNSAFARVFAEWQTLARGAAPMLAPEFALLTARLLGDREILLFGARRGDALVAALPMVRRGRTLLTVRGEHTPRVDLVGDRAALPALWRALRDAGGWDVLEMQAVPADSPLAIALPKLAALDRCKVVVRETSRAPWFFVEGIEQRIHRRFRGDMRRLERQVGGVELEQVVTPDHGAMRDMLRLEAAAWKGAAGTAIACSAELSSFYRAIARLFARRGELSIAFLRTRGIRIAGQFALEDTNTRYLIKVGYDPEYAHFGPGQLLVRETASDAARRGLRRYDLLGQDTPWKTKWTDLVRPHVRVRVYAPSALGRARHFVREVARPLGGDALRALRAPRAKSSSKIAAPANAAGNEAEGTLP